VATYYQPARAVGGDFYDFVDLPDGRLGLVVGDVTDKGVPAALVMATTRSILRAGAQRFASPGAILEYANDMLCPDIPPNMFVTCLYAMLDPNTGRLQFANAGHDLPYRKSAAGVEELRATGMPLGLMPGMKYDEREVQLEPDDMVLFYTDGLVEAHNPQREMFGFPHLKALLEDHPGGLATISYLLDQLVALPARTGNRKMMRRWWCCSANPHPYPLPRQAGGGRGRGFSINSPFVASLATNAKRCSV